MPHPCSATLTDAGRADTSLRTITKASGSVHLHLRLTNPRGSRFSPGTHKAFTAPPAWWILPFLRTLAARHGASGERATNAISTGILFSSVSSTGSTHPFPGSRGAWTSAASRVHTVVRCSFLAQLSQLAVSAAAASLSTLTSGTRGPVKYGPR